MTPPARAVWRFLRREGGDYVFAAPLGRGFPPRIHRVPVERFWGGAR